MQKVICLTGSDADGTLSALARILRQAGKAVFTCVVRDVGGNLSVAQDGQADAGVHDLTPEDPEYQAVFEHIAAKAAMVVRIGLQPLTPRLDAGCTNGLPAPQVLILRPGDAQRIRAELAANVGSGLALLRILERHVHTLLAGRVEQALCLRATRTLLSNDTATLAAAVLSALEEGPAATQPLSGFYKKSCPVRLPAPLLALSTEILAMRTDADAHFKLLRDTGHVAASVLLPGDLPLPGGRHLAYFMRETALCPPPLWEAAPPAARDIVRLAVTRWILEGPAEGLEVLLPHVAKHVAVAHAALLCGAGGGMNGMNSLCAHMKGNPALTHPLPAFVYTFAQCCASGAAMSANAILDAVARLPRQGGQLVWGCAPIISNKYWSQAMRQGGNDSCTLMPDFYGTINAMDDYDLYFHDVTPPWAEAIAEGGCLSALLYVVCNASVIHMPFRGGPLAGSSLARFEPSLLRAVGVKSVMIPYGSDAYMYSRLGSTTLSHVLNVSYPSYARDEKTVRYNVLRWSAQADFVLGGAMTVGNGFPRWDALVVSPFCINTTDWQCKENYSGINGKNGVVRILHCPNHRAFKGTEYIIAAVEHLQNEDLNIELVLLEKVQNSAVRQAMLQVDILVDQCLAHYALNAIEGMVSGLPVCSNLEEPDLSVLRRFSYLDECPVVSVTPETLADCLRVLVCNPDLRRRLGQAGRQYVEKYHSYNASLHLFGAIHDNLLRNKKTDINALYHPLLSAYVKENPVSRVLNKGKIRHEDTQCDAFLAREFLYKSNKHI